MSAIRNLLLIGVLMSLLLTVPVFGTQVSEPPITYESDGKTLEATSESDVDTVVAASVSLVRHSLALERTVPEYRALQTRHQSDSGGPEYASMTSNLHEIVGVFRDRSVLALEASQSFLDAGDDYFGTASRLAHQRDEILNVMLRQENELNDAIESREDWLRRQIEDAHKVERSLDRAVSGVEAVMTSARNWWSSLIELRTALVQHAHGFPGEKYPDLQYVSLDWQTGETALTMDKAVPPVMVQTLEGRIEHEKLALSNLSNYLDLQIESHKALNAYRFVSARSRFGVPGCKGDARCVRALNAELLEAEGRMIEADARARGIRGASAHAVERNRDVLEFEQHLSLQHEKILVNARALNDDLDRLSSDARAAVENAYAVCEHVENYFGISIPECHMRGVESTQLSLGADNMATSPPFDISNHAFLLFNYRLPVPGDYGAYTYVIFPTYSSVDASPARQARYEALLEAIVHFTQGAAFAVQPRHELNLFAIPSTITCDGPNDPETCLEARSMSETAAKATNYDFNLGLALGAILNSGDLLRPEIQNQVAGRAGPFLITTQNPIHLMPAARSAEAASATAENEAEGGYLPLMLVDLSIYEAGSFQRIVAAYKSALVDSPPATQTIWTPPTKEWIYANVVKVGALSQSVIAAVTARIGELKAL